MLYQKVDVNGDVTEVHTIPSRETTISLLPPTTHCVSHHATEKPLKIDVPRGVMLTPSFEYAIELIPEPTLL